MPTVQITSVKDYKDCVKEAKDVCMRIPRTIGFLKITKKAAMDILAFIKLNDTSNYLKERPVVTYNPTDRSLYIG